MRPVTEIVAAQAVSNPIPMDTFQNPFNVGIGVTVSAGATLTYKVQHTFDDVFSPTFVASSATWFDHATLTGKTASSDGNYAYPITALRLNVTAYTSGSATITVVQAGMPGR